MHAKRAGRGYNGHAALPNRGYNADALPSRLWARTPFKTQGRRSAPLWPSARSTRPRSVTLGSPEVLESARRQLCVADGMRDVPMSQVVLLMSNRNYRPGLAPPEQCSFRRLRLGGYPPTISSNPLSMNACIVSVRTFPWDASSARQRKAFSSESAVMINTPS